MFLIFLLIKGKMQVFIDTAGIRESADTVEKIGIERSLQAAEKAELVDKFNAGLANIKANGKYDEILAKYLG